MVVQFLRRENQEGKRELGEQAPGTKTHDTDSITTKEGKTAMLASRNVGKIVRRDEKDE